ncbi:hypothetical protein PA598K_00716 [Paenibacillus sp. 598K]|uniref:DUF4132 domain-containing protein n=1 Tax=Paenibacillus sp. 598K TaxID=1117987 RepID=UPI000FFA8E59|nr:DUF4132 domain-containing protein [Paenibacillus sp. 598K]GBF72462.1 hypothetical protein PA598K_00716 [Paenibacillus sp. 598K]
MLTEDKVQDQTVEKSLQLFINDMQLDDKDAQLTRQFVGGEGELAPQVQRRAAYFSFRALDATSRLSAERGPGDDTLIRMGAMLLRMADNYWIDHVFSDVLGQGYRIGGLSEQLTFEGRRDELLREPLQRLLGYVGDERAVKAIEEFLWAGGLGPRDQHNVRMLVQGLLALRIFAQARPAAGGELLEKVPPLVQAVVLERADEVTAALRELLELPLRQRCDYNEPNSSQDLDAAWIAERRARAVAAFGAGSVDDSRNRVPKKAVRQALELTTGLLLYRVHLHGGKSGLLASDDAIDRQLLQAARLLHEVYPFEVRDGLLETDSRWAKTAELLEGLVPLDEPFQLIEDLREAVSHRINWIKVPKMLLEDPEQSRRAYAILEHPFLRLVIHKTLADAGEALPDGAGEVGEAALAMMRNPSYGGRYGLMLGRYLAGEATLEQYLGDKDARQVFHKSNRDTKRVQVVIAATVMPPASEAGRRLTKLIIAPGVNTRECLSELYQSVAFDGPQMLELHGEHPEVDADKLLEALILLNGLKGYESYAANGMDWDVYKLLLARHLPTAMKLYGELSTAARELIFELAMEQGESLDPELRVEIFKTGLAESSKKLRRTVLSAFAALQDAELYRQVYLAEKKSSIKELTLSLLRRTPEAKGIYAELLKVEKNAGLRQLIEVLLETAEQGPAQAHAALARQADAKQTARLAWISAADLPTLRDLQGEPLDDAVRTYALLQSVEHTTAPNELLEEMKSYVDAGSLADLSAALIRQWIEQEAPAKEKWVLYLGALFGDIQLLPLLGDRIKGWADNSRGAIAAEAVKILSYVNETSALIAIDNFRRTIKNKQVRGAAEEALELAAENAGLTPEQLADRLISSLGFDESGVRRFSYGPRSFLVKVTREFQLEVSQEDTGKSMKNLPAAGAKDDAELAKQAKAEFNQLKKDLKTMATIQVQRLEESLSKQRLWTASEWKELFVSNVVMHQFAVGLVWGVYGDGGLETTFRYMDDGTFNTVDEDEYELPADARIGLVHPLELDEELLEGWKTQLADYEIRQPFEQLERQIYATSEEQRSHTVYSNVPGEELSATGFPKALEKYGWSKGPVEDAGFYHIFVKNYGEQLAELRFSGTSVTYYEGLEPITLQSLHFFQNRRKAYHNYFNEQGLKLEQVPARVFSESVYDILRAAGR